MKVSYHWVFPIFRKLNFFLQQEQNFDFMNSEGLQRCMNIGSCTKNQNCLDELITRELLIENRLLVFVFKNFFYLPLETLKLSPLGFCLFFLLTLSAKKWLLLSYQQLLISQRPPSCPFSWPFSG